MESENILEVRDVCKNFPGVKALKNVTFNIPRGHVHCIIGENGAGKSTFIKVLTGAYFMSSGEILFDGEPFAPKAIRDAMESGISVLYQELNVVDELTVEQNLTLGREKNIFGYLLKNDNIGQVAEVLRGLDPTITLDMEVGELSVAQKQVIEIAKAISTECKILIMDEPTASLSEDEVRRLFEVIFKLKEHGITIIFISHKLTEIFEIGDSITAFRDGMMIDSCGVPELLQRCNNSVSDACVELVRMMLGKVVIMEYIPSDTKFDKKMLEVKNISNHLLKNVSFDLFEGEILGFYGLMGSGKTEISRAVYGVDKYYGEIVKNGQVLKHDGVRGTLESGIALVPEERRVDGIFGKQSIENNIPMMRIESVLTNGLIDKKKQKKLSERYIKKMSIACRDKDQKVENLSGGNQQKVVIAKCLNRESDIILLDEPTRGVDVGAKKEIHDIIRGLANEGKGIMVFSSELPEIMQLCDRIILLHDGEICRVMKNSKDIDSDEIMHAVAGGK